MSVLPKLSSSLNQRDETANQELAREIVQSEDQDAVKELIENLGHASKNIQGDCVKVLYEIGEQKPELIAGFDEVFISLLQNKNNRLVWGAMSALDGVSSVNPEGTYQNLPKILDAADKGSVITKDHGVSILIKLAGHEKYRDEALVLLLSQLSSCPANQLPMYAENALPVISGDYKLDFLKLLRSRLGDFEKESKRKRVEKVISRLGK